MSLSQADARPRSSLDAELIPRLSIEDCLDGSYAIRYRAFMAGRYLLCVVRAKDEMVVGGSPRVVQVVAGAAVASHTLLVGKGVHGARAGETTGFFIIARDRYGNQRGCGGDLFKVELLSAEASQMCADSEGCKMADHLNGRYSVSYRLERVGQYSLKVALRGELVSPPLDVYVGPGPTHADTCSLDLSKSTRVVGLKRGDSHNGSSGLQIQVIAGSVASLHIQARDAFGHAQCVGGDQIEVTIRGCSRDCARLHDCEDGTYKVSLSFTVAGAYQLLLSLIQTIASDSFGNTEGTVGVSAVRTPLSFSPIDVLVEPASFSDGSKLEWRFLPERVQAGAPLVARVRAFDAWGNRLADTGGIAAFIERFADSSLAC